MRKILWLPLLAWAGMAQAKVVVQQVGQDVDVDFIYSDRQAGGVVVAGNFNEWSLSSGAMVRNSEGLWHYVLHGVKSSDILQYKFVVGTSRKWVLDPDAPDTASDGKGGLNGQVVVKQFLRTANLDEIPADLGPAGETLFTVANVPGVAAARPVDGSKNLIADAGFETGKLDGWTLRGDTAAAWNELDKANAHAGEHSLKYTSAKGFKLLMLKHLTGLAPGIYSFRGWAAGSGGETTLRFFARDCGSPAMSTAIVNTGWQKWRQFTVKGIQVKAGECTVGLYVDAAGGIWGNVDDLEFYEDATWARLTVEPTH